MTLLTLAIPTFNRLKWLEKSLSTVLDQARELPAGTIEVLVSDNCSTDGTAEFLRAMSENSPQLKINRNPENIGAEANFQLLSKLSGGRYLYMIGDDDILVPGALERIIAALQKDPDYVAINFAVYDERFEHCVNPRSMPIQADAEFRGAAQCLDHIPHFAMGFISAWVGRKEFFNVIPALEYQRFARWGMSLMADRYVGVARFQKGMVIAEPLLNARRFGHDEEKVVNFEYFDWFLRGAAEVLHYAVANAGLSPSAERARRGWMLRHIAWKRILFERSRGSFNHDRTYDMLKRYYGDLALFWLLCVPMMTVPGLGILAGSVRRMVRNTP